MSFVWVFLWVNFFVGIGDFLVSFGLGCILLCVVIFVDDCKVKNVVVEGEVEVFGWVCFEGVGGKVGEGVDGNRDSGDYCFVSKKIIVVWLFVDWVRLLYIGSLFFSYWLCDFGNGCFGGYGLFWY